MAGFPLEPSLAKMLIVSEQLGCTEEVLTIVALLSVTNIFFRCVNMMCASKKLPPNKW